MEYLETFQLVESVHVDPKTMSILGKLNYDNAAWEKSGGVFGVQLLDAILHQTLILATHSAIYYAGGFDACHFVRTPATKELYVHFTLDKYRLQIGRKKKVGDFALYDGTGQLVLYMQGFFTVFGSFTDNYKLCDLLWQPFEAPALPTEKALHAYSLEALTHTADWTAADNERLTSWLVEKLRSNGALEVPAPLADADAAKAKKGKGKEVVPLVRKVLEALEARMSEIQESASNGKEAVLPKVAKLDERAEELVKALTFKIQEKKKAAAASWWGAGKKEEPQAQTPTLAFVPPQSIEDAIKELQMLEGIRVKCLDESSRQSFNFETTSQLDKALEEELRNNPLPDLAQDQGGSSDASADANGGNSTRVVKKGWLFGSSVDPPEPPQESTSATAQDDQEAQ